MALHSPDVARFSWRALAGYPARTLLMLIAMAIGVGSVVVLTALGEGARGYVTNGGVRDTDELIPAAPRPRGSIPVPCLAKPPEI